MNVFFLIVAIIFSTNFLACFLLLTGFFEKRESKDCLFQTKKYALLFCFCFLLNLSAGFFLLYGIEKQAIDAVHIAEKNMTRSRVGTEYGLNNLSVMFSDKMGTETRKCWSAGLSRYVEDQWKTSYLKESCPNIYHVCGEDAPTLSKILIKQALPTQNIFIGFGALGLTNAVAWKTARHEYEIISHIFQSEINEKGERAKAADMETMNHYMKYISNCATMLPAPWVDLNKELLTNKPHLCWGHCDE